MNYGLGEVTTRAAQVAGSTTLEEGVWLYRRAKTVVPLGGVVVEIGSFLGKSTIFLASGIKPSKRTKVYAIDPHRGDWVIEHKFSGPTYRQFVKNITQAGVKNIVVPLKKTSRQVAREWKLPAGLLFIDGDHSYRGVRHDLLAFEPWLVEGGTLAIHDALNPGVGLVKAVSQLLFLKPRFSGFGVVGSILYATKKAPGDLGQWLNWYFFKLMLALVARLLSLKHLPAPAKRGIEQYMVKRWLKQLLNWISLWHHN